MDFEAFVRTYVGNIALLINARRTDARTVPVWRGAKNASLPNALK